MPEKNADSPESMVIDTNAPKPLSQTFSVAFYNVTFTKDSTTPVFSTESAHNLNALDKISITRSTSEVIIGEGKWHYGYAEWLFDSGTTYTVASVAGDGGDPNSNTFILEGVYNTSLDTSTRTIEFHSTTPPKPVVDVGPKENIAVVQDDGTLSFESLLTASAEWKPQQIAKAGDIATLAKAASSLAETVKDTLKLAQAGMEVVRVLAALASINPILDALNDLADEVLAQIRDLKDAGYWYLYIDPYFVKNVSPKQKYSYGFEQLRNQAGERLWEKKDASGNYVETTTTPSKPELDSKVARPRLASPRKSIPGGYDRWDPLPDPLKSVEDGGKEVSAFPTFTVGEVINEFVKAFDDEGDVPRYRKIQTPSALPKKDNIALHWETAFNINLKSAEKASIVYDVNGNPYRGWDPEVDMPLELFDMGKLTVEKKPHIKEYIAGRKPINIKKTIGKPNQLGNTKFDGGCAAIAIIIGAPNFDEFHEVFNKFSKMFSDIPEFAANLGKNLDKTLQEFTAPDPVLVSLTMVDTDYGQFGVGDIIAGEKYGSLGKIISVNAEATSATTMEDTRTILITDDAGNQKAVTEVFNPNAEERWLDMQVELSPIRTLDGFNDWMPGDDVLEMEKRGQSGNTAARTIDDEGSVTLPDVTPNYMMKGLETVELPKAQRIYPKIGKVAFQALQALPAPVPPNFGGIMIKDIVPGWGTFFSELENFVIQIQGYISDSQKFIQDMIDQLSEIMDFLEYLIKAIDEFLEFFQITLPAEGVYALYIPNQDGGSAGIQAAVRDAKGIPRELGYASGILFVGTEADKLIAGGGSKNPIDLLAIVLGLL
jgi:hypothetical protein